MSIINDIINTISSETFGTLEPLETSESQDSCETIDDIDKVDPFENVKLPEQFNWVSEIHNDSVGYISDIGENSNIMVRISGSNFQPILQYIDSHDPLVHNCFIEITNNLIKKYDAQCGYTFGDNILLFFSTKDIQDGPKEPLITNTEIVCSEMVSYTTIRFDKCINNIIDDLTQKYTAEISQFVLDQDPIFRGIAMVCSDDEIIEYFKYIIHHSTEYLEEETDNCGTIVKPCIKSNNSTDCTYRTVTQDNYSKLLSTEFIMKPFIQIIKKP